MKLVSDLALQRLQLERPTGSVPVGYEKLWRESLDQGPMRPDADASAHLKRVDVVAPSAFAMIFRRILSALMSFWTIEWPVSMMRRPSLTDPRIVRSGIPGNATLREC